MDKKVLELSREAGFDEFNGLRDDDTTSVYYEAWPEQLERFAALVEDDFKNRLARAIEQMPFGDTATSFATFVRNFK